MWKLISEVFTHLKKQNTCPKKRTTHRVYTVTHCRVKVGERKMERERQREFEGELGRWAIHILTKEEEGS